MVSDRCPRALLNMETAGHFERADDVVHLAPCDDAVRELCDLLGWRDELEKLWAETESLVTITNTPSTPVPPPVPELSQVDAVKTAIGDDLARLLNKNLNLNDAEKNAKTVASNAAATMDGAQPTSNARKATASIRVSLAWVPEPAPVPDEESVLVLTGPFG
ncbi:unnamed protein product, partial [Rhizoctonia solani]